MDRLSAMQTFARVVESGSFARASERLNISTSVASRQVADLEAHLKTRLLHRTTRKLSLTESGQAYYERVVQLLADLDEAEQSATRSAELPQGTLRVNAALAFGVLHLAPALCDFLSVYPGIRIDVTLSDRVVDLVEEGYDLAIRIGTLQNPNLIARKLGSTRAVLCASRDYLQRSGMPRHPEDLAAHNCLLYTYTTALAEWRFTDGAGKHRFAKVAGNLHANNGNLLREAALLGAGIILQPDFLVADDIRAGRLVKLLPDYPGASFPISAVFASRKHLSAKVRSFVDFLAERFGGETDWKVGRT